MIRLIAQEDAGAFHFLSQMYNAESGQQREYSWERTQAAFDALTKDPSALVLVADAAYGLAGAVIAQLDHAFTVQPVCLISMFYLRDAYRGTGLARAFMQGVVDWADNSGCTHTFTSGNAMLSEEEDKLFQNLCAKFGFMPAGTPVLARRKS